MILDLLGLLDFLESFLHWAEKANEEKMWGVSLPVNGRAGAQPSRNVL